MEINQDIIDRYYYAIVRENHFSSKFALQFYLDYLFEDVNFRNKRVIDIGAGAGIFAFYAASMRAKEVVCLEPGLSGSNSNTVSRFCRLKSYLPSLRNLTFEPISFQAYKPSDKMFDVVLLHNSINHLDEYACINLLKDKNCRTIYKGLLAKIGKLSSIGAILLVCDCSRYNFFSFMRVKNPFTSTIEWKKHHTPEVWVYLLSEAGFSNPKIAWKSFRRLGYPGKLLFRYKLVSFFVNSHFRLKMEKVR